MLPVKWMPPEAFLDGIFTSKTDGNIIRPFDPNLKHNSFEYSLEFWCFTLGSHVYGIYGINQFIAYFSKHSLIVYLKAISGSG